MIAALAWPVALVVCVAIAAWTWRSERTFYRKALIEVQSFRDGFSSVSEDVMKLRDRVVDLENGAQLTRQPKAAR